MNTFQIPPGVSSYYQGFWNHKTKSFEKGSDIEVYNECVKACGDSTCKNKNCLTMKKYCQDNCMLYPESYKTMINCMRDNTCGRYPNFDKKCIVENKDTLIKCCKTYCNTNLTDCNKDCEGFYDLILNGKNSKAETTLENVSSIRKNNYNIFIPIIGCLFILFLIKMKKYYK
jgi:hypothetical protein